MGGPWSGGKGRRRLYRWFAYSGRGGLGSASIYKKKFCEFNKKFVEVIWWEKWKAKTYSTPNTAIRHPVAVITVAVAVYMPTHSYRPATYCNSTFVAVADFFDTWVDLLRCRRWGWRCGSSCAWGEGFEEGAGGVVCDGGEECGRQGCWFFCCCLWRVAGKVGIFCRSICRDRRFSGCKGWYL